MFIIFKPREYVAGVFSNSADLAAYIETMPDGEWDIIRKDIQYPFGIIEHSTKTMRKFEIVENRLKRHMPPCTYYTVEHDYNPGWQDCMGLLPHVHIELNDDEMVKL